jgi:sec-independent protein translocase protein TatC
MSEHLMTFTEHLQELRKRLKYCMYSIVVGALLCYAVRKELFVILVQPLIEAWTEAGLGTPKLHFLNPIEPFFTYLKIALISGVFLSAPVIFYQIWQFVAPGLYKKEKRYVIPFTVASAVFFLGGAAFGYFMVFPYAFQFFFAVAEQNMGTMQSMPGFGFKLEATLMMGEILGLIWRLLLAFGIIFELPLVIFFLSLAGIVDYRQLWRFNRYFIILSFVIGAALTPPDVITQLFMAGPLLVLYNLSILLSYFFTRKRVQAADQQKKKWETKEEEEEEEDKEKEK